MSCEFSLPRLSETANKYTRGKLTLIAGSKRYTGAAVLAARAAQRSGAGYTEVITAKSAVLTVRLSAPSLVVRSFSSWCEDELPVFTPQKPCAVCVGPGFEPHDAKSGARVLRVLKGAQCAVLVDGGALMALSTHKAQACLEKRQRKGWATIITPHEGEAARLAHALKLSYEGPQELAQLLASTLRCIVVLKGPCTYITSAQQSVCVTKGTPALAKAGTGDVLAGIISALLAQGMQPFQAAYAGVTLHARAGVEAARTLTETCVCPEDVIEALPEVFRKAMQ